VVAAVGDWLAWLCAERRVSPHTYAAYARDLGAFLEHLRGHLGGQPDLAALAGLAVADFRSFLAARARRGIAPASSARAMSTLRSFFRFLDRSGRCHNPALAAVRSAKLPRSVPRPLAEGDALELVERAGEASAAPWLEKRDEALLTLLYGCGLRIAEALGLDRDDAPSGDMLRVVGKGAKERLVPVLPVVRGAIAAYLAECPFPPRGERGGPLFLGARGGRLNPGVVQRQMRTLRSRLGLPASATPHALRHSFATHLLAGGGDRIRLRDLVDVLGDRAFGILILIFALPNAVGLGAIPGVSAVFGLPQLFVALQMMIGRTQLWLPDWLLDRSIARGDFAKMVDRALPYLQRAERVLRPRLPAMSSYAAERVLGFVFAVLAGIVSLPIPFGNQPPALAMAIISVGLAERDGLTVVVGLVAAVIAIAIAAAVVVGGLAAIYLLFDQLF
jgi:integrase/recombinase XerC